jgi:hypothetical protein
VRGGNVCCCRELVDRNSRSSDDSNERKVSISAGEARTALNPDFDEKYQNCRHTVLLPPKNTADNRAGRASSSATAHFDNNTKLGKLRQTLNNAAAKSEKGVIWAG